MEVKKDIIYYLIVAAVFLFNFAFIPLLFEVLQQRQTSNIPYVSLFCFLIAQAIYLFIVFFRNYHLHTFIYLVGFICVSALIFLKHFYDKKNIHVIKKVIVSEEQKQ
jgi:uncharacterized protein with PQ loop repeat